MEEPSFWQVVWTYLRVAIAYWWALLPGAIMPTVDAINWHRAESKKIKVRPWLRVAVTIACLILAQFLAYRNSIENLSTVISDKRQQSIAINALKAKMQGQETVIGSLRRQVNDLGQGQPRVVTRTLPAPEPEKRC